MKDQPATRMPGDPYLREWREHTGLTLERVAELVGAADKTWLSKRENRKTPTTTDDLKKLAGIYKCSVPDLFTIPVQGVLMSDTHTPLMADEQATAIERGFSQMTHTQLAQLVLSLPKDAIPVVGLFVQKLLESSGDEPKPRPLKAGKGA